MISVCMATFNGEKYLEAQIDSILKQLQPTDELIVSDDGSTDSTLQLLQNYQAADLRVRLVAGPKKGLIRNFENAIKQARGEIIFLADQDDVWLPEKVAAMVAVFREQPQVQVVIGDLTVTDVELHPLEPSFFQMKQVKTGFWRNIWKNGYIGAGMAFRSQLKETILPFPEKLPMHDMWIGLLAEPDIVLLRRPLTLYRRHGDNASELQTTTSLRQKISWRFHLILALARRKKRW